METARTYPTIEKLVGVDISDKMIEYARSQAESLALGERVQFRTMDALRILDFPPSHFNIDSSGYLRPSRLPFKTVHHTVRSRLSLASGTSTNSATSQPSIRATP